MEIKNITSVADLAFEIINTTECDEDGEYCYYHLDEYDDKNLRLFVTCDKKEKVRSLGLDRSDILFSGDSSTDTTENANLILKTFDKIISSIKVYKRAWEFEIFFNTVYYDLNPEKVTKIESDIDKKRIIFRGCVAYMQAYKLNKVIFVEPEDMLKHYEQMNVHKVNDINENRIKSLDWWREIRENEIKSEFPLLSRIELMGCYVPELNNKNIIEKYIKPKCKNGQLPKNKYNDVIFLCVDNMEFFRDGLSEEHKKLLTLEKLIELVFIHEIGHLLFSPVKIEKPKIRERQANFVASCVEGGIYDKEIEIKTSYQSKKYQDPLLICSRYNDVDKFNKDLCEIYGW